MRLNTQLKTRVYHSKSNTKVFVVSNVAYPSCSWKFRGFIWQIESLHIPSGASEQNIVSIYCYFSSINIILICNKNNISLIFCSYIEQNYYEYKIIITRKESNLIMSGPSWKILRSFLIMLTKQHRNFKGKVETLHPQYNQKCPL